MTISEVDRRIKVNEAPQDQKDLVSVAKLAGTLDRAKFRNWLDVFRSDKLPLIHRVGEVTMRQLADFRHKLLDRKQNPTLNEIHTVKVSFYTKRKGYQRRVYNIDGISVVFVNPEVNAKMELLLRGDKMSVDSKSQIAKDIRREINFLNRYFALKISVIQESDEERDPTVYLRMQQKLNLTRETTITSVQKGYLVKM